MKLALLALLTLGSTQAIAGLSLVCDIGEGVFAPNEQRSKSFTVIEPLTGDDFGGEISLTSENFNVSYSIETYLAELINPGQHVVLISLHNNADPNGVGIDSDGHNSFGGLDYTASNGVLTIDCSVK